MQSKALSVLLLNPPYKEPIIRDNHCCFTAKSHYMWPPVDLLYLSAVLTHSQINIDVIDAVIEEKSWGDVSRHCLQKKPDVIIMLTGTVSFDIDLNELQKIVMIHSPKVYLLGNTPTFRPLHFMKTYDFVTGIIHNFFDTQICDVIFGEKKTIKSMTTRDEKEIIKGTVNYLKPNEKIIFPKAPKHHLFPLEKYTTPLVKRTPMATVLTAFGCPFTCKFCIASALDFHARRAEDLKIEFDSLKKNNVKEIFFEDSTFNKNAEHLSMVCNLLIEGKYNFTWSANVHSFNITDENLQLMKKAGCHTVQIGVESGNQDTLNEYAPSKRKNNIQKTFELCKKNSMRTLGYFIIGFPTETVSKAQDTITFAKELDPDFASFSVMTPDYGTKLFDEAVEKKLIDSAEVTPFDCSEQAVLKNSTFTKKQQDFMIEKAYKEFYFRPGKMLSYLKDYSMIPNYLKNGMRLIKKKLL